MCACVQQCGHWPICILYDLSSCCLQKSVEMSISRPIDDVINHLTLGENSSTLKVWGLIAQCLANISHRFPGYQHFTRVYTMSQNDSQFCGKSGEKWWGLVVIVRAHRVVGCLKWKGVGAHNCQISKSGTMVDPRGGGLGWLGPRGLGVEGHIIFEMLKSQNLALWRRFIRKELDIMSFRLY